jgi:hypothetical protein
MFVEVLKNGSSGGVKTAPVPKYSLKSPVPDTDAVSESTQPGITLDGASLGATIIGQNPYTGGTDVTLQGYITFGGPAANNYGPNGYTMPELKPGQIDPREYWYVGGERLAITKTIRIPYSYTGDDGTTHMASIVIGYNGPPMP